MVKNSVKWTGHLCRARLIDIPGGAPGVERNRIRKGMGEGLGMQVIPGVWPVEFIAGVQRQFIAGSKPVQ